MGLLHTACTVAVPLLAMWSVLRVWFRGDAVVADSLAAYCWSAVGIALGRTAGPWWLPAVCWTTAGATLLSHVISLLRLLFEKPLVRVDPARFRERLLEICGTETGPEAFLVGVGPDGTVVVRGLEAAGVPRHRHRPGPGCATCYLEEFVRELAVNGTDAVDRYRGLLKRRANRLFLLRRGVLDNRWTAELRQVPGFSTPFAYSPCAVHRL
ncbi:hypothetical protein ABT263_05465 [Kitasatospora sp. NPDC001603]|uniref:hypothetical protein n=1 Tax=Kitasatospora sp. NPDC001603 TaxID=3154388 RepID=UPI00332BF19E